MLHVDTNVLMSREGEYSDKRWFFELRKQFINSRLRKKDHTYKPFLVGTIPLYMVDCPKYSRLYSNTSIADWRFTVRDFYGFPIGYISTNEATTINKAIQYFRNNKKEITTRNYS